MLKNIEFSKAISLEDEVIYASGQVVSKTLVQNKSLSITLFAFSKGEGLTTHTSIGDAMIQILDGHAKVIIDNEPFELAKGQTIVMPANIPHSVEATTDFKMMLTVVFPE